VKDYYKILEVDPKATIEQIKSQYRFLIHAWHPDKFPNGEFKDKAEEKIKEINEAFSVIGDPVKRENYDRAFHSYASPPPPSKQQTYYSPPAQTQQTQSGAQSQKRCESCGLPAETKYVRFYENVGMLFIRQHREVKGNLCKPCINYYFWNLTGKTMLFGWWGVTSFIVTPFILLNNLLRFIFTAGMKKPPVQIAPSPSPFWVFSTIVGFLLIGFFIFSMFSSASVQPPEYSYSPTTVPAKPTSIPTKVRTPTASAPPCIRWDKVTSSMAGQKICVYGTVYNIYNTDEATTRINFTSKANTFFLIDLFHVYPDLKAGDCVVAEEVVQLYDNKIPYMSVFGLYVCESWMK
jgi:hypothetical protein